MSSTGASKFTEVSRTHPTRNLIKARLAKAGLVGDDRSVQEDASGEALDAASQPPGSASRAQVSQSRLEDRHLYDDPCYYLG